MNGRKHFGDPCISCGLPMSRVPIGPCQGTLSEVEIMREAAARCVEPTDRRPCDCDRCNCGNQDDAAAVAVWDYANEDAKRIRALPLQLI